MRSANGHSRAGAWVPPALGGAGLDLLDALDGVFWVAPDGTLRFHALLPPTDAEVARRAVRPHVP